MIITDLKVLGEKIKTTREKKGISLNKMSKDMHGNRYRVNHLINIEKGLVDVRFQNLLAICDYLGIKIKL